MNRLIAVAMALTVVGSAAQARAEASAATLGGVDGKVMALQNGKPVPLTDGSPLQIGERIVAGKGDATVTYPDGCKVSLTPNTMTIITAVSPCASQAANNGVVQVAGNPGGAWAGYGQYWPLYIAAAAGIAAGVASTSP